MQSGAKITIKRLFVMKSGYFNRVDVDIFNEILKEKYDYEKCSNNNKAYLLSRVQEIQAVSIQIDGTSKNKKQLLDEIEVNQHGFKSINDLKAEFQFDKKQDKTTIRLIPTKVYELEDKVREASNPENSCNQMAVLLSDAFERLKVKAMHVIKVSTTEEEISHYAKKNIQLVTRMCYDGKIRLEKIQNIGSQEAIFSVYLQNIFLMNVLSYWQKMFSHYYDDKRFNISEFKIKMYESFELSKFINARSCQPVSTVQEPEVGYGMNLFMQWNDNTNVLATYIYRALKKRDKNKKPMLEADIKNISQIVHMHMLDKNGKRINKNTFHNYLKDSREDKRASEGKTISLDDILPDQEEN